MKRVLIGCSGWNYKDWKGPFYPAKGCPASRWLEFYAQHFPTVEINEVAEARAHPLAAARRTSTATTSACCTRSATCRPGATGNYSDSEVRQWAARIRDWAQERPVFAYFNNDWNAYAIGNARLLTELVSD